MINKPSTHGQNYKAPPTASPPASRGHSRFYDIPLLENDGNNFNAWKFRVRTVLDLRDLWEVVDGTFPKPNCTASLATRTKWTTKNREARAQIVLTLKDEPLDTVIDAATAEECWERLLERYEGRGTQRKMQLLEEIFKSTFTDSDPLEPQINSLLRSVRNLGSNLSDDIVVAAIISALPSSLGTLKTVLANSSEDSSPAELKARIIADEQRRIRESGIGATAFFAKAAKKTKEKDRKKTKKRCTHCRIRGHVITECRKLKKEQESKSTKPRDPPAPSALTTPTITSKDPIVSSANVAVAHSSSEPVIRLFMALALDGQAKRQDYN